MRIQYLIPVLFLVCSLFAQAQSHVISGPMPGYTTMTEAGVWLQLDGEGLAVLEYWDREEPSVKKRSEGMAVQPASAYTARFILTGLKPGKTYEYNVLVAGQVQPFPEPLLFRTQALWQYRTDPPAFKVALGSCAYINEEEFDRPGTPYGSGYAIFETIAAQAPDMMLWLGDNIYLREPDWRAWSGYLHRYTHARSLPELQKLLRSTHHYATWDDHDFGPNDANGSWIYKDWAVKSFEMFWMNPTTGIPGLPGITTAFSFNDIDFFLLDNRYHRTPHDLVQGEPQILGKQQVDWLVNALKYSNAPFKMVAIGGQVLNTARVYETHAQHEKERDYLIQRITEEKIKGVVFLTGDRHHTELSKYTAENGVVIYDLTVSPLTSGTHANADEDNKLREQNTLVTKHNFGILEFTGPRKSRQMNISIFDRTGEVIWAKSIESQ